MRDLIVADTGIRQDAEGRYCLNDLHRAAVASGANSRTKEPGKFMASPQTIELVHELTDTQNLGIGPVNAIKGGTKQGTYVVKELVYAYAMWISPAFHLKVIRAYDRMVAMTNPPFATSNLAHGADLAVAAERTFRSFLRAARSSGRFHGQQVKVQILHLGCCHA